MAITRSQQARQMLKKGSKKPVEQAGVLNYMPSEMVTVPKVAKSSPTHPTAKLAYITDAEKKLLIKKNLHGSLKGKANRGPGGIPSLQGDFGPGGKDPGGFRGGGDYSSAETGNFSGFDGTPSGPKLPPGVNPKPSQEALDLRSAAIAAGAGQRVNPSFFDSRNIISPIELARARQFAKTNLRARQAMRKTRGSGLMNFITGGGFLGNIIRGLGQKFGLGKRFDQPTYDMSALSNLPLGGSAAFQNLDIRDKYNRTVDDEDENINLNDYEGLTNLDFIDRISERDMSIPITPYQKDIKQDEFKNTLPDDVYNNLVAVLNDPGRIQLRNYEKKKGLAPLDPNIDFTDEDQKVLDELLRREADPNKVYGPVLRAADGGHIGGGIMDAAGRQNYFLGKLVKKATRAVKKIVKSPVGKLGIGAALAFTPFGKAAIGKFAGLSNPMKYLIGGAGLSALPLIFGKEEEQGQGLSTSGSVGGQIPDRAYTDPYSVLFGAFKAEGGSMKDEPVAKRTMPLLDMGGQEMDLRAEGGFVPIGRMEKADDVPARLSKNEFVFTADAVRNAGDGDVDKGAEVMYNMMKNLEAGGEVSEESQGLEGARNMFQTSKRLEEVL